MNLRITISDSASPRMQSDMRLLTSAGLTALNRAAGVEVQRITFEHVAKLAATRHATAAKLGASPTNYLASAAEKVAAPSALSSGPAEAILTINHPGFSRAFRSVKITPKSAKALTIPIHALSYGRRAGELWDRLGLFIPKGKRIIAATIGGVLTPLYVLTKSVTQKQDRTLLPSDQQFQDAAVEGAKNWIRTNRSHGGKL